MKTKEERREYHKKWRDSTDREKFKEGQRRRHKKWYYSNLEKNREAGRLSMQAWREKHPGAHIARVRAHRAKAHPRARHFVEAYKETIGCLDCGFSNPAALDFDHRNPREKRMRVAVAIGCGWSLENDLERD